MFLVQQRIKEVIFLLPDTYPPLSRPHRMDHRRCGGRNQLVTLFKKRKLKITIFTPWPRKALVESPYAYESLAPVEAIRGCAWGLFQPGRVDFVVSWLCRNRHDDPPPRAGERRVLLCIKPGFMPIRHRFTVIIRKSNDQPLCSLPSYIPGNSRTTAST